MRGIDRGFARTDEFHEIPDDGHRVATGLVYYLHQESCMHDVVFLYVLRRNVCQDIELCEGHVRRVEPGCGALFSRDIKAVELCVWVLTPEVQDPDPTEASQLTWS